MNQRMDGALVGVLFDIDALGGGFYGAAAYQWLFSAIGRARQSLLAGAMLFDGDTNTTLAGNARLYCIAAAGSDGERIAGIRACVARAHIGLLGLPYEGPGLRDEPLVLAVRFDADGCIAWCDTPWVIAAWHEVFDTAS